MKLYLIPLLMIVAMVAVVFLVPSVQTAVRNAAAGAAQKAHDGLFGLMSRTGLILGMTTLAVDKSRAYELGDIQELPVVATDIIYEGAAVGDNGSGYARPLVAADPFLGFAESKVDNSAGAAGDKNVRVKTCGQIVLSVTGVTGVGDVGEAVYASDDDTFTLTSTSNTAIGKVARYISGTSVVVAFEALPQRSI
jgi:hypothetical protein